MVDDGWADLLANVPGVLVKADNEHRILTDALLNQVLKIPADRVNDTTTKRLGAAMRKLGWHGPKQMRVPAYGDTPGKAGKGYWRPGPGIQHELEVDHGR
jgi:hypothetical protein